MAKAKLRKLRSPIRNGSPDWIKKKKYKPNYRQYTQDYLEAIDFDVTIIKSGAFDVDRNQFPDQTMNHKKHQYDVMYRKVKMKRLEQQWKNKQFNEIKKIFVNDPVQGEKKSAS